jgi:hypothetical protein
MATSGRGSGVVGYNVQVAVETENHLIVTHKGTTSGSDRSQLARVGKAAKAVMRTDTLEAVADRGYFNSPEILACHEAGITVTLPKPMTSNAKSEGRFGKQDFIYVDAQDVYICPAGQALTYRMTTQEGDKAMRRYWTTACGSCPLKKKCTTAPERRIPRWEHEHVLEAVQARLDADPQAMRRRRETVEHPFGTLKARMGATHFLMRTLPKVAAEMALHRAGLQSDPRHEHHRRQAAAGGHQGVRRPTRTPLDFRTDLGCNRAFLHDQDPKLTVVHA